MLFFVISMQTVLAQNPTSNNLASQRQADQLRIQQQNQQILINNGFQPPSIPPSDPALSHQYIINQYNQNKSPSKKDMQMLELRKILDEEKAGTQRRTTAPSNSKIIAEHQQKYADAFASIKEMLDGKKSISIREAYYQIENAYGNTYLSYQEYTDISKQSVDFIRRWLTQNGYSTKDNDVLNMGIQRFMSDTLTITVGIPDSKEGTRKVTHLPFFYDYNDFKGERDFRNYFSTKTLATGSGQCNSLPAVYLILAEGLGAKAYLTFAPLHSFVKYPDSKGNIQNYEPTSNWNISDQWYEDNMFISKTAKQTGIYLDTLNKRQIIANCLIELASSYIYNFGAANDTFILGCVKNAMGSFPRNNNIEVYFIYSILLRQQMYTAMQKDRVTDINNIQQSPKALSIYQAYLQNEEAIKRLGYQDMPTQAYNDLMQQHEFKGKRQALQNISGKEKRNQFLNVK